MTAITTTVPVCLTTATHQVDDGEQEAEVDDIPQRTSHGGGTRPRWTSRRHARPGGRQKGFSSKVYISTYVGFIEFYG